MLRFYPEDPELRRIFKLRTYRYYLVAPEAGDVSGLLAAVETKLGVGGLTCEGVGDPAGWIGTADAPRTRAVYWRR